MESVKQGVGRETAHEAIKEHAVAAARGLRDGTLTENNLLDRLAADPRLKLSRERLTELFQSGAAATGAAANQVNAIAAAAAEWLEEYPEATEIRPGEIL